MGEILMGAMMFGGFMSAGVQGAANSTVNLDDTCNQIASAKERLSQVEKTYQDLLSSDVELELAIDNYKAAVGNHKHNTQFLLQSLKNNFKQQELANLIGLSTFVFILVLTLLLKKFNIIKNIWNYFVN